LKAVKTLPQLIDPKAISKLLPKKIPTEKERLYEENLSLKQMHNAILEENMKLRTKVQQLKKRSEGLSGESPSNKNVNFVDRLKSSIKEMKSDLQSKNKEITELKKHIRFTKINELETELEFQMNECEKLRSALNEISVKKLDSLESNHFKGVPNEKENFKKEIKELKEKLTSSDQNFKKIQESNEKLNKEKENACQLVKELENRIKELESLENQQKGLNGGSGGQVENVFNQFLEFFKKNSISVEQWVKSLTNQDELTRDILKMAIEQDSIDIKDQDFEEFFKSHSKTFIKSADFIKILGSRMKNDYNIDDIFEVLKGRAGIFNKTLKKLEEKITKISKNDKVDKETLENFLKKKLFRLESDSEEQVLIDHLLGSEQVVQKSLILQKFFKNFKDFESFTLEEFQNYLDRLSRYLSSNFETCISSIQEHSQFKSRVSLAFLFQELSSSGLTSSTKEKSCLRSFLIFHSKSPNQIDYLKMIQMLSKKTYDKSIFSHFEKPLKKEVLKASTLKSSGSSEKIIPLRSETMKQGRKVEY
jgi:hypothetical protein